MPVISADTLGAEDLKGVDYGTPISLILDHSEPGHGPQDRAPSSSPLRTCRTNNGPGRSNMVCIHANPTMVTERLE